MRQPNGGEKEKGTARTNDVARAYVCINDICLSAVCLCSTATHILMHKLHTSSCKYLFHDSAAAVASSFFCSTSFCWERIGEKKMRLGRNSFICNTHNVGHFDTISNPALSCDRVCPLRIPRIYLYCLTRAWIITDLHFFFFRRFLREV